MTDGAAPLFDNPTHSFIKAPRRKSFKNSHYPIKRPFFHSPALKTFRGCKMFSWLGDNCFHPPNAESFEFVFARYTSRD